MLAASRKCSRALRIFFSCWYKSAKVSCRSASFMLHIDNPPVTFFLVSWRQVLAGCVALNRHVSFSVLAVLSLFLLLCSVRNKKGAHNLSTWKIMLVL